MSTPGTGRSAGRWPADRAACSPTLYRARRPISTSRSSVWRATNDDGQSPVIAFGLLESILLQVAYMAKTLASWRHRAREKPPRHDRRRQAPGAPACGFWKRTVAGKADQPGMRGSRHMLSIDTARQAAGVDRNVVEISRSRL